MRPWLSPFVVIGAFVRGAPALHGYWRHNLFSHRPLSALLQGRIFTSAVKTAVVLLFLLTISAGVLGDRTPTGNFTPTFVWVIWWVGLGFFVALVGNLWAVMNPWSILFEWAEELNRRFRPHSDLDLGFEYPSLLGTWPAFALFCIFAWLENVYPQRLRSSEHSRAHPGLLRHNLDRGCSCSEGTSGSDTASVSPWSSAFWRGSHQRRQGYPTDTNATTARPPAAHPRTTA